MDDTCSHNPFYLSSSSTDFDPLKNKSYMLCNIAIAPLYLSWVVGNCLRKQCVRKMSIKHLLKIFQKRIILACNTCNVCNTIGFVVKSPLWIPSISNGFTWEKYMLGNLRIVIHIWSTLSGQPWLLFFWKLDSCTFKSIGDCAWPGIQSLIKSECILVFYFWLTFALKCGPCS